MRTEIHMTLNEYYRLKNAQRFPTLLYSRDMGKYTRLALLSIILYIERERKTRNKRGL
jgi:hypothetical protein